MATRVEQPAEMAAGRARLTAAPASPLEPGTLEIGLSRVDRGSPQHLDPTAREEQAWVAGERWFKPEAARLEVGALVFEVGPSVTWRLKPFMPYLLHLRDGTGARVEERLSWPRVRLPSVPPEPMAAESVPEPASPPEPVEDPLAAFAEMARAAPPEPPPIAEPPRPLPEPARGRGRSAIVVVLALLLLAGAGYAAYRYLEKPEPPVVTAPPEPAGPEIAMTVEGARSFILTAKPSGADAAAMAKRFTDAGAMDGAFLLLQHAARNGDAKAAEQLGRLYDPKFFTAGKSPVAEASADRAIDWYERAAEAGDAEAIARLPELLKDPSVTRPDAAERATFWSGKAAAGGTPPKEATP